MILHTHTPIYIYMMHINIKNALLYPSDIFEKNILKCQESFFLLIPTCVEGQHILQNASKPSWN